MPVGFENSPPPVAPNPDVAPNPLVPPQNAGFATVDPNNPVPAGLLIAPPNSPVPAGFEAAPKDGVFEAPNNPPDGFKLEAAVVLLTPNKPVDGFDPKVLY